MTLKRFLRRPGAGLAGAGVLLTFCLTAVLSAWAEIPAKTADQSGVEQRERPGRERPDLPAFIEAAPPEVASPQLAPAAPRKPSSSSAGPRVRVTTFRWRGNTVFSDEELSRIAGEWLNREITFEDLQKLRLRVTRQYVDHGYINSGAVIPDQEIVSGEIRIDIVEGRLADVDVSGNDRLKTSYVKSRLMTAAGPPLNINDLQAQVQVMHQDPLIDRVNAELSPGLRLGEAILAAEVAEASPYVLGFEISNRWSPRVGSTGGEIYTAHRNLTGWGDALGLRYGMTRGLKDILAYYNVPVTPRDTLLKFRYEYTDSDVVEDPFDDLDITGKADTFRSGNRPSVLPDPQPGADPRPEGGGPPQRDHFFGPVLLLLIRASRTVKAMSRWSASPRNGCPGAGCRSLPSAPCSASGSTPSAPPSMTTACPTGGFLRGWGSSSGRDGCRCWAAASSSSGRTCSSAISRYCPSKNFP